MAVSQELNTRLAPCEHLVNGTEGPTQGRRPGQTEAETGIMQLEAADPRSHQKPEPRKGSFRAAVTNL